MAARRILLALGALAEDERAAIRSLRASDLEALTPRKESLLRELVACAPLSLAERDDAARVFSVLVDNRDLLAGSVEMLREACSALRGDGPAQPGRTSEAPRLSVRA